MVNFGLLNSLAKIACTSCNPAPTITKAVRTVEAEEVVIVVLMETDEVADVMTDVVVDDVMTDAVAVDDAMIEIAALAVAVDDVTTDAVVAVDDVMTDAVEAMTDEVVVAEDVETLVEDASKIRPSPQTTHSFIQFSSPHLRRGL